MTKLTLAILLLLSAVAWAAGPADYSINVHVSASRLVAEGQSTARRQRLSVVINGRKYELESATPVNVLFGLGDYKAKLAKDEHKSAYDSSQTYEFLFPDNRTRKFDVVAESE